jgi:sugar phosphate isomerase/epimerase
VYIGTNFIPTAERTTRIRDLIASGVNPLRCFVEAELDFVELSLRKPNLDRTLLEKDIDDLHAHGLKVNLHPYYECRGYGSSEDKSDFGQMLRVVLEIAGNIAQTEGRMVVVNFHAASGNLEHERDNLMAASQAFFERLLKMRRKLKVDVMISTEFQLPPDPGEDKQRIADNFDELLTLVSSIKDKNFGVCWDMGHTVMASELHAGDPYPPFDLLSKIKHVHIHDVKTSKPKDHQLIGTGDAPLAEYLMLLGDEGYTGDITMEYDISDMFSKNYGDFLKQSHTALNELLEMATSS